MKRHTVLDYWSDSNICRSEIHRYVRLTEIRYGSWAENEQRGRERAYWNWPLRFRWLHWGQAKPCLSRTWGRWRRAASGAWATPLLLLLLLFSLCLFSPWVRVEEGFSRMKNQRGFYIVPTIRLFFLGLGFWPSNWVRSGLFGELLFSKWGYGSTRISFSDQYDLRAFHSTISPTRHLILDFCGLLVDLKSKYIYIYILYILNKIGLEPINLARPKKRVWTIDLLAYRENGLTHTCPIVSWNVVSNQINS